MSERKRVVGLGAGGHAKVVLDILLLLNEVHVVGLTDANPALIGQEILGVPIIGTDEILPDLRRDGVSGAFVGTGSVGDCRVRRKLFEMAREMGFELVDAIHPDATVARSVQMGRGVAIMAQAALNPGVVLGDNVIVNTGAQLDHDCQIGDHVHIAPGAHVSGGVRINDCAHVGVGATIIQGIHIGARAIVGAGAVVLHDVPPQATVVGVPARAVEERR